MFFYDSEKHQLHLLYSEGLTVTNKSPVRRDSYVDHIARQYRAFLILLLENMQYLFAREEVLNIPHSQRQLAHHLQRWIQDFNSMGSWLGFPNNKISKVVELPCKVNHVLLGRGGERGFPPFGWAKVQWISKETNKICRIIFFKSCFHTEYKCLTKFEPISIIFN